MLAVFKPRLLAFTVLAASTCFLNTAQAASVSMQLDDFHSHCDIRQLGLSNAQLNNLRAIRSDYKRAADKAYRKGSATNRNRRQNIIKILSQDSFDSNAARDYVESRYLSSMDFAVDELQIQHRLYKMLSYKQRQQWLSNCLK
ncbi:Spy/CpxP family protein refolding chaperone [Neisseria sp.]|uniref:Spy/CpxP family protein refolding chaperone n=1 Tax=Neisseria sp. TaxID=192066 RepID=UPI00359FA1CD